MSRYVLASSDLVTVHIDGEPVEVPKNYNLIQACEKVGKYVPHYCWHPSLSVPGNCRLCLVRVEGAPKLVAGCHTLVAQDMKIDTQGDEVEDNRAGQMEFLLANHPLDCPVCDRGGECSLQRFSMDYGQGETRFYGNQRRRFHKPNMDPLISIERNRCIHCTRCVRFCDEIAGDAVMGMFGRGDQCYIGTFGDGPVSNIFSGNVIDICPVGCLTNKPYRFKARPWELRQIPSVCTLCSSGCRVTYWMRAGFVYRTTPPTFKSDQFGKYMLDYDTTDFICNQGRFGNDFGRHKDRIAQVQVKKNGKAEETTFDEGVDLAAEKLKAAADNGKAAVLVSPRLVNEELFLAQLLARKGLKTNNIDWRAQLPHAAAAHAFSEAQAIADGSIDHIEQYDTVLLLCSSAQQTLPVAGLDIKEAARRGQIDLYVAGTRHDRFFSDQARGTVDVEPNQIEGFLKALAGEGDFPMEDASGAAGRLREALGKAEKALVAYEPGHLTGHAAVAQVSGVRALKKALGDKLHTLPLVREANGAGAFFAGAQPDRLPAAPLHRGESLDRYNEQFKTEIAPEPGLTAPEILEKAADGEIEALLILGGGDLLEHHPNPKLVSKALEKTAFIAVSDIFPGVATAAADVVFPHANHYERTGTMLNVEGRIGLVTRAEHPLGASRPDFELLLALGDRLGVEFPGRTVADVFKFIQKIAQTEGAVESGHVEKHFPKGMSPQLHVVFRGAPKREKAEAFLRCTESPNGFRAEQPALGRTEGEGLTLLWDDILQGRDHNGDRATQRDILQPKPYVEIHPETAAAQGLHDRDQAVLTLDGSDYEVRVKSRPEVPKDAVYVARNVLLFAVKSDLSALPKATLKPTEQKDADGGSRQD